MTITVLTYPTLPGLMFPVIRIPEWDTDVQISLSGKRTAFARRAYPRYRYELSYSALRTNALLEFQTLLAFYNSVNGRAGLFNYIDSDDKSVSNQLFGTGDSSTTDFQLVRTLAGTGLYTFDEPVFYIASSQIFKNGVSQSSPADYSINTLGLVTFTSPPVNGDTLTWTGTFGYYCRFDEDIQQFEKFLYNIYEIKKVKFSTEVF